MRLETGRILQGRYRIVNLLGQGGFGAVYRAWDLNLKKLCAVKENFETHQQGQEQFENEATVLASLIHPNLPRVTDHFVLPGQGQYLVMDFVEGQDLNEVLSQREPIPIRQAVNWISQIASALDYLHTQKVPVIHRDIKPANIRVTAEGRLFLVDFGLVKRIRTQALTMPGARGVTPGFSPPEQYGHGGTDDRTDIYSLAATFYTLLTGVTPPESVHRYGQKKLTPVHVQNPNVPYAVSAVIQKALSLDPVSRYQSVGGFKSALDAAMSTQVEPAIVAAPIGAETVISPFNEAVPTSHPLPQQRGEKQASGRISSQLDASRKKRIFQIGIILSLIVIGGISILFLVLPPLIETIFNKTATPVEAGSGIVDNPTLTALPPLGEIPSDTPSPVIETKTDPTADNIVFIPTATPFPTETYTPSPSPIEYDLTFASDRNGEIHVYVMDTQTGAYEEIITPSGYERAWWPSFCGDLLAVEAVDLNRSESREQWIYLVSIDGETVENINPPDSVEKLGVPRCSPNGSFLTYSGKVSSIWRMFVSDFSSTSNIAAPDSIVSGYASWSAVENVFIFQGITSEDYRNLIFQITGHPLDGQFHQIGSGGNPAISPNGNMMVFSCESEGNDRVLCTSSINGDNKSILVKIKREKIGDVNVQPSSTWSLDGQWIYFASAQDGDWDIYRIRPDGNGLENLTNHWGSSNEIMPAVKW